MKRFPNFLQIIAIIWAAAMILAIAQCAASLLPIDDGQELSRLVTAGVLRGAV